MKQKIFIVTMTGVDNWNLKEDSSFYACNGSIRTVIKVLSKTQFECKNASPWIYLKWNLEEILMNLKLELDFKVNKLKRFFKEN